MSRLDEIPDADWQPAIGGGVVGGIDDVAQCIQIILVTPVGSDPLRPTFGSNIHKYIDWPQPAQTPYLIKEAFTAIRAWEKRIGEMSISIKHEPGAVLIEVNWQPISGDARFTTTVSYSVGGGK